MKFKVCMHAIWIENQNLKKSVQLTVEEKLLVVLDSVSMQVIAELPVNDIEFHLGGSNDSLLFIKPKQRDEIRLYVEYHKKIVDELKVNSTLSLKLKEIEKKKSQSSFLTLMVLAIVVSSFGLLFHFRQPLFGSLSFLIPFSVEKKAADQIFNPKLNPDQKQVLDQMNLLLAKLNKSPNLWQPEFVFHISSETVPNAYATIGGHIFINKGLILILDNSEDLLGVVAHEMIHVQKRHVVKSIFQGLGVYTALSFLFGDVTGLAAILVDQGGPLLNLQYTRELEEESDRLALEKLTANNINPIGLSRSLLAIQNENKKLIQQSPGSEILEKLNKIELLNSHPEIEKRIAQLKKQAEDLEKIHQFKPVDFDYEKFKSQVKNSY